MKDTIKKILKETVDNKKDKFERYILKTLKREGFKPSSTYHSVIKFITDTFGISGMEAFELYQLFLDNYGVTDELIDLVRKDVTNKKVSNGGDCKVDQNFDQSIDLVFFTNRSQL